MVEAASDANKAYEEENERLRMELEAAQQQLAAVQQKQSSLPAVLASHTSPHSLHVYCRSPEELSHIFLLESLWQENTSLVKASDVPCV